MPPTHETERLIPKPSDFDEILLNAIDDALSSLGESVKQSIYFHLKNQFKIDRQQIPKNLNAFQSALQRIFGLGAGFIEISIMKNLYSKIGNSVTIESAEKLEFISYVKEASIVFQKK
jgi:hypothetical protein